jgi:hypothetical protein
VEILRIDVAGRLVVLCLVVCVAAAGVAGCSSDDGERATAIELVTESLGGDDARLTETELECMQQHLRVNSMLASDLRRVRDFDDLDAVDQSRAYEALAPCIPTALGRAVLVAFLDATGESDDEFVSDSQADCVSQSPFASKWVVDMRYAQEGVVISSDEARSIVSNIYLCGRDVVVNGPLARALDVDRETATCVARQLETRLDMVPEVAQIMFGHEGDLSQALTQLISGCRG